MTATCLVKVMHHLTSTIALICILFSFSTSVVQAESEAGSEAPSLGRTYNRNPEQRHVKAERRREKRERQKQMQHDRNLGKLGRHAFVRNYKHTRRHIRRNRRHRQKST
jgi:hypothetical protein